MSTSIFEQSITGPVGRGVVPVSLPLPGPESNLSLLINALGIHYRFEAPLADSPLVEGNKISARFILDGGVYLDLNLVGQSGSRENEFDGGRFSIFYHIEERRPRAQFVADTIMAVLGLAGSLDLKITQPNVSTPLSFDLSLLEISKMLHRRQTAYRLMLIEEVTGKRFLLPSGIWDKEIRDIAFVYHAIVDRSFVWPGRSFHASVPATPEDASLVAQLAQSPKWQMPVEPLSVTLFGQPIDLGRSIVTIEDAVISNAEELQEQLSSGDGCQVALEIRSLSGQDKYEFVEIPYSSEVAWEQKIQTLIGLEPYLDAAITERYHALAAATLSGLTDEEKQEVTTSPDLDESFVDINGE